MVSSFGVASFGCCPRCVGRRSLGRAVVRAGAPPGPWARRERNPHKGGSRWTRSRSVTGVRAGCSRVVAAIERIAARAAEARRALRGREHKVSQAIPYDGAMWFGLDPATLLAVSPPRMEHLDDGYCHSFWIRDSTSRTPTCSPTSAGATHGGDPARGHRDRPIRGALPDFLRRRVTTTNYGQCSAPPGEPGALPASTASRVCSVHARRRRRPASGLADRGGACAP